MSARGSRVPAFHRLREAHLEAERKRAEAEAGAAMRARRAAVLRSWAVVVVSVAGWAFLLAR